MGGCWSDDGAHNDSAVDFDLGVDEPAATSHKDTKAAQPQPQHPVLEISLESFDDNRDAFDPEDAVVAPDLGDGGTLKDIYLSQ
eukprot:m.45000 g.45000  ORF g.45000 m.45000 type:complete len:84 (+) comp15101_c0_seq1:460-711(+)